MQQSRTPRLPCLDHLDSVRSKRAIGRRSSEETGGQILGILRRLDPSRAAEEALAHPSFGYVSPRPNLAIEATPGTTNFRFAPPESGAAPDAQSNPVGALASAEALADKVSRFRALAQLAQRNASLHPEVAAPAANDAYALLDKEIVAQTPLVAIHLADSLQRLGNARAASVVVSDCLAYAATAAALVGDQFAELEAGDQAEQWSSIKLASETLLLVYFAGARMEPAAAEAGARAIRYAPLRAMAEAASAAGEAGVPNLRSLLSLVGASS